MMNAPPPKSARLLVSVIWGAMMLSVVIHGVVAHFLSSEKEMNGPSGLLPILGGVAVAGSLLIRRLVLKPFIGGEGKISSPKDRGQYMAGHIVVSAMAELCSVLALVLAITGGPMETVRGMLVASLLALLINRPLAVKELTDPVA